MNRKTMAISEAAGCGCIFAAAAFLHIVYPLSMGAALGILFGAVNESVWEHTKIFSVGYVAWSLLQLFWMKLNFRKYVAAKCIGLYVMMGLIIVSCRLCMAVTGGALSIFVPIFSVIAAQALSYRLETGENRLEDYFAPALMLLSVYYLMFFSFTAFPPKAELFRDPTGGFFGIPEER